MSEPAKEPEVVQPVIDENPPSTQPQGQGTGREILIFCPGDKFAFCEEGTLGCEDMSMKHCSEATDPASALGINKEVLCYDGSKHMCLDGPQCHDFSPAVCGPIPGQP